MNFFNSVVSDDSQPSDSPTSFSDIDLGNPNSDPAPETSSPGAPPSAWNLGSLIKTITTRSETVIGVYRRDLQEFRSGLINETALACDVASRAVKEFPGSGAAVGKVIHKLGSSVRKGTSVILARGKELNLFDDDRDDSDDNSNRRQLSLNAKKYCWFDARVSEIQGDLRTYTEEPGDLEDYIIWKSAFFLDERAQEIENLMAEVLLVKRSYLELVPVNVDKESFWSRYFYKASKLKQAEEARAKILKRVIVGDDEEDLSWDVDEDDNEVQAASASADSTNSEQVCESSGNGNSGASDASESNVKVSGEKNHSSDSCKDSELSIISRPLSFREEEELEWDEIDDVGSGDDKNVKSGSSVSLSDLRKRLYAAAAEDEDLSWDFEDDDEPI